MNSIPHDIISFRDGEKIIYSEGDYIEWVYWHLRNELPINSVTCKDKIYTVGDLIGEDIIKEIHWKGNYWYLKFNERIHWLM